MTYMKGRNLFEMLAITRTTGIVICLVSSVACMPRGVRAAPVTTTPGTLGMPGSVLPGTALGTPSTNTFQSNSIPGSTINAPAAPANTAPNTFGVPSTQGFAPNTTVPEISNSAAGLSPSTVNAPSQFSGQFAAPGTLGSGCVGANCNQQAGTLAAPVPGALSTAPGAP